jgi:GNAT superfamily N-acetyltransferase
MILIETMALSGVPSDVISLTRPGMTSAMKQWVSEAKRGDSDGTAWLAWEYQDGFFLTNRRLVGWACVYEGEFSIYVKPSERRRGIGTMIMDHIKQIGPVDDLLVKPHNRIAEQFFERHEFSF